MKKMFSRLGVLQLVAILFLTNVFTASALTTTINAFGDVDSMNGNFKAINYLKENKVVQGYADGTFKPENKINRAEFLKIVMEAAGKTPEGKDCYKDVKDVWYSGYVCAATKLNLVQGYGDGSFKPEKEINFAEASKIISNTMGLVVPADDSGVWYKPYVQALTDKAAIPQDVAGFNYNITRGQMAEMVWRIKTDQTYAPSADYKTLKNRELAASSGGQFQKFSSCLDLKTYLEDNSTQQVYYDKMFESTGALPPVTPSTTTNTPGASKSTSAPADSAVSTDHSTTNLQVQGVDEADIVKNDDKYIYGVKANTVRIVQAYPADSMKELDKLTFENGNFYPSDLYVDGNRLIVLGTVYDSLWDKPYMNQPVSQKMMMPIMGEYYYGQMTKVYIFDITDKSNIKKIRDLSYEGDYTSSRKVGDMLYLVLNKNEYGYRFPQTWTEHEVLPLYKDSNDGTVNTVGKCEDVLYVPGSESTNYVVVAGIPTKDADSKVESEIIVGSGGSIYASPSSLYVAEQKYNWFYANPNAENKEQTLVHKFSLSPSEIKYQGKAEVPGHIINQFSMDESGGNFRIATTLGNVWDSAHPATNNIYVLNSGLKQVGKIEGIAPGEEIYSVRFAGDKAYMVTFKKIDPFFVIGLSDPANPKILGKLKIPGFSDYLEPYDENHIIGFGKDAVDASEELVSQRGLDFAWYQGLKIAMFDVTDVSNPVEMFKTTIGDRGSDTPLLYDHKALLFDKAKGLLALPVTVAEIPQKIKDDPKTPANTYGEIVFQGAYVYNVSLDKGFDLKGKITHYTPTEVKDKSGYYWYGDSDIQRILYIGENLYTVSKAVVKANLLNDLSEVKSLKLAE
ncbi:MAG: beta-propeller domain-containing protein [Candidatus Peregrinibacteria bacterium]|nr:beta-propeller domain-containing protein [Candidatus Peregrinibacteria bacterium]